MYCKNCGTKLNEENRFCPECGDERQVKEHIEPIPNEKEPNNKKWIWVGLGAAIVCVAVIALIFNIKKDDTPISSTENTEKKAHTEVGSTSKDDKDIGLQIVETKTDENLLDYIGKTRDDIIEEFGPNYEEDYYNGGTFITYDDTPAFFYNEATYEIESLMTSGSLKIKGKLMDETSTFAQIEEKLGPAKDGGESEVDDSYYIYYKIENYDLYFSSVNEDGTDWGLNVISR